MGLAAYTASKNTKRLSDVATGATTKRLVRVGLRSNRNRIRYPSALARPATSLPIPCDPRRLGVMSPKYQLTFAPQMSCFTASTFGPQSLHNPFRFRNQLGTRPGLRIWFSNVTVCSRVGRFMLLGVDMPIFLYASARAGENPSFQKLIAHLKENQALNRPSFPSGKCSLQTRDWRTQARLGALAAAIDSAFDPK
jgi:hypothetical protein